MQQKAPLLNIQIIAVSCIEHLLEMYTKLKSVNVQQINNIIQMNATLVNLKIMLQGATVAAATTTSTTRYGGWCSNAWRCTQCRWSVNLLGPRPESRSLASLAGFTKRLLLLGNLTKFRSLEKSLAVCINWIPFETVYLTWFRLSQAGPLETANWNISIK